jgi:hypothetical protein
MGIEIHHDPDCEEPYRTATLAIMGHMGDENPTQTPKDAISCPVYRYEHSGTAFSTKPFSCPWDSALTGYIYETKADIRKEFGVKRISAKLNKKILDRLKTDVQIFGQWANGECCGYVITETDESCWGFYSHDDAYQAALEEQAHA